MASDRKNLAPEKAVTKKIRSSTSLLESILDNYKSQKKCSSPYHSRAMQALQLFKNSVPKEQEVVYRGILLRAINNALLPNGKLKINSIDSCNIEKLENIFLEYYDNNYFTKRTMSSFSMLYERVWSNKIISQEKSKESKEPLRDRISSTSTTTNSTEDSSYTPEEEYKMFRENYAILLVLKELEIEKQFKLSQQQFALYQSIFISFVSGTSCNHQELVEKLKLDSDTNEKIKECKERLARHFPHALDQLPEDKIEQRQKNISHTITTRDAGNSIVLQDDRLDNILSLWNDKSPVEKQEKQNGGYDYGFYNKSKDGPVKDETSPALLVALDSSSRCIIL